MNDKWFLGARRVFFALFACWVTLPAFATHRALVEETADAVKVGNGSVELIVPKVKGFQYSIDEIERWRGNGRSVDECHTVGTHL